VIVSYFIQLYACMCMMWCIEDGPYVEYAKVEDFQDLEQLQALVEGKSLLHTRLTYTICILITPLFIYCFALNCRVLLFKV
jgi:hypothetical protein